MQLRHSYFFIFALALLMQCKDPYHPPFSQATQNFLVVDGFIDASGDSVHVTLSRAVALSLLQSSPPETKATVYIEDDLGTLMYLSEKTSGNYWLSNNFSFDRKYKLHIQTVDGEKYSSDFITLQQTPPIDSLAWSASANGLALLVNAHDASGKAKYYRWAYEETWQYDAPYPSSFVYDSQLDSVMFRQPQDQIYICWQTELSTQILLYTTSQLQSDVVGNYQVLFLPKGSPKLYNEYSVLVKQQALSEEAYNFFYQLQTTTQSVGGLFDALPSQVIGNVQCESDANQTVLGFFNGGSVSYQRVFIKFLQLPIYLQYTAVDYSECKLDSIPVAKFKSISKAEKNSVVWISGYGQETLDGYTVTSPPCGDCRTQGGTNIKPLFWQ